MSGLLHKSGYTQNRGPQFTANHRGRLAAQVPQIQCVFDATQIEFHVPAKAVYLGK